MRIIKPTFFVVVAFLCLGWLSSCTFSQSFNPEVNSNINTIADSINSQYHFEDINLAGKTSSGTSGKHTTLRIRFTNGQGLPSGNEKLQPLAKKLALQILGGLKDEKKFDNFNVEFGTSKTDGSVTRNNYFDFDFTRDELNSKQ